MPEIDSMKCEYGSIVIDEIYCDIHLAFYVFRDKNIGY